MFLNKIVDISLRRKIVALALIGLITFGGLYSLSELPVNSLPDVTPIQVLVITKAGRYSPYDVERFVSYPIETAMNGLPKIKDVKSISQFGLSAVTIEFEEDTDIFFARQMVSQKLQSVLDELPEGVSSPQLGPISTALGEIYQYVVRGDGYTLTELRTIQDWIIAPQLKTIKGINEINAFGGFVKQFNVEVLPAKLKSFNISIIDVFEAIAKNNSVSGGNFLEHNSEQYIIRGFGQIRSIDDINNIVLVKLENRPVFLRDVATVSISEQIRQGAVTQDGKGEVVTGIVMMLRGGNGREVIASIHEKIDEINKSLPPGVVIEKFYDQSDLVNRTTGTITVNLLEGGFFVIAVLLLLLGELKGALIVASVIPFSMLFAFMGMREFGLTANLMSLGAIDFGIVVDGAVVMVENIVHRLHTDSSGKKRIDVIREAAYEVTKPVFFGLLIILMVYVPIATFSGIEGILFRPMAITVATAVFGSLILTLIYVPAISSIVFKKGVKLRKNYLIDRLKPLYISKLKKNLNKKFIVLLAGLIVFISTLIAIPFMGTEFIPELDEGSILIEQIRLPSITLEESVRRANIIAGRIKSNIPEVETILPKTGRSDLANDWMGVHQTDVWVILKPDNQWRSGVSKSDLIEEMKPFLDAEPGLSYNFTQPIAMRVDELTSGVKADVAVKIFGDDLDVLNKLGASIASLIANQKGTDNFFLEKTGGQTYLNIEIDRFAIANYGLNVDDIQQVIEIGIGGSSASYLYEGQQRFEIVVKLPDNLRNDFSSLKNIPVHIPGGGFVALQNLAQITPQEGPREIARENGWRRVIVGANLKGIDIGTYVNNLKDEIETKIKMPPGYFVSYGGSFEDQERAMKHLLFVVPLAIFIIFGLLYLMFNNLRHSLLIFINLPFALTGGVLLLIFRDFYLSVSASIGFVALFGVAVLNGIVLISHINDLRDKGVSLDDSIIRGASDRLRPVLMTALVASLGFIPMAFNTGPGSEVQRPLATVVIGGLITSTLSTLMILPVIYHAIEMKIISLKKKSNSSENKE